MANGRYTPPLAQRQREETLATLDKISRQRVASLRKVALDAAVRLGGTPEQVIACAKQFEVHLLSPMEDEDDDV